MVYLFSRLVLAATLLGVACSQTIVELITNNTELSTLLSTAVATDVAGILSGDGPFTVLAPTNDAFNALGLNAIELDALIADGTISTILKGHAASGTVLSTDLFEGQVIPTVSGLNLTVSLADGVTFTGPTNTVKVTMADMKASNGVIHVIDAVIMPAAPEPEPVSFNGCYDPSDNKCKCETNYCGETECLAGGRYWVETGCPTECVCTPGTEPPTAEKSIIELITDTPELSDLLTGASATDVGGILGGVGPFTVLAPTNDAFDALGFSTAEYLALLADGTVSTILKGHAASGTVLSTDLFEGQVISTVSGLNLTVSLADGVTFTGPTNTVKVTMADMKASNGVIHVIDTVILPAIILPTDPEKSIVELITDTPELSALLTAASATDVAGILSGDGPFTVLAPTNDAFDALGFTDAELDALVADGTISTILKGHAASGTVLSTDLSEGQVIPTVSGLDLTVSLADGVTFTGPTNTVKVTMADMKASNGVIHVIDTVIMPAAPASNSAASEDPSEESSPAFKLMVGSALASAVVGFALL